MKLPTLDFSPLESAPQLSVGTPNGINRNLLSIVVILVATFVVGIAVSIPGMSGSNSGGVIGFVLVAGFIGLMIAGGVMLYSYTKKRTAAIQAFMQTNGLTYQQKVSSPHPGVFFLVGHDQRILERAVIPTSGSPIEIGNYRYVTGSGKNRSETRLGYMRLTLPRPVPHMMLDSRANNLFGRISNIPGSFNRNQVLSLEGDFDKYFTLYAPQQYERDALYIFTPDVIATLIDHAADYDVEVIDDSMFIYSRRTFNFASQAEWEKLFTIASSLSPEFEKQTYRYTDDRVPQARTHTVGVGGKRLKRGFAWSSLFVFVIIGLQVLPNLASTFARDGGGGYVFAIVVIIALTSLGIWARQHYKNNAKYLTDDPHTVRL